MRRAALALCLAGLLAGCAAGTGSSQPAPIAPSLAPSPAPSPAPRAAAHVYAGTVERHQSIASRITGITYPYHVYLPEGYASSGKRYPVVLAIRCKDFNLPHNDVGRPSFDWAIDLID